MRLTRQLIVRDVLKDAIKIEADDMLAPLGLSGILGASVAALMTSFLLANMFLRRTVPGYRPRLSIRGDIARGLVKYTSKNYIAGMIGSTPYLVLPVLVVNLLGAEQGAYFFVAWSVATVIFIAIDAISTSFFAAGSQSVEDMKRIALRSLKIAYLILAPIVVLILLFTPDVLTLFGEGYPENSSSLLMLLSICTIPMAFNELYANTKRINNEMRALITYNLASAVGILGLGALLMLQMGIIGLGVGFLLSQFIIMLAKLAVEAGHEEGSPARGNHNDATYWTTSPLESLIIDWPPNPSPPSRRTMGGDLPVAYREQVPHVQDLYDMVLRSSFRDRRSLRGHVHVLPHQSGSFWLQQKGADHDSVRYQQVDRLSLEGCGQDDPSEDQEGGEGGCRDPCGQGP